MNNCLACNKDYEPYEITVEEANKYAASKSFISNETFCTDCLDHHKAMVQSEHVIALEYIQVDAIDEPTRSEVIEANNNTFMKDLNGMNCVLTARVMYVPAIAWKHAFGYESPKDREFNLVSKPEFNMLNLLMEKASNDEQK